LIVTCFLLLLSKSNCPRSSLCHRLLSSDSYLVLSSHRCHCNVMLASFTWPPPDNFVACHLSFIVCHGSGRCCCCHCHCHSIWLLCKYKNCEPVCLWCYASLGGTWSCPQGMLNRWIGVQRALAL